MKAGVLKETWPGETRVAVVPGVVPALVKAGIEVVVEAGRGRRRRLPRRRSTSRRAPPSRAATTGARGRARSSSSVRSFAGGHDAGRDRAASSRATSWSASSTRCSGPRGRRPSPRRGATSFALELLPRISRAQSMDALSSTATMVGYKAVLLAADALPRMMPMMMTAAGTVAPARVFVIGAGVAGLQAIATARRLGAVVEAYDVRPAVKDQIQSLGAKFVELPLETAAAEDKGGYAKAQDESFYRRQRELLAKVVADSDVVISAAAVPGKKAPVLVTDGHAEGDAAGVGDRGPRRRAGRQLRGERVAGETSSGTGCKVMGPLSLATTIPHHASQLYARNVANFVLNMVKKGELQLDAGRRDRPRQHAHARRRGRRARGSARRSALAPLPAPQPA